MSLNIFFVRDKLNLAYRPTPPQGPRNFVKKSNINNTHQRHTHQNRRRRLPHNQPTLYTNRQNTLLAHSLMGTQRAHMRTNYKTFSRHTPLLPLRCGTRMGQPPNSRVKSLPPSKRHSFTSENSYKPNPPNT